MERFLERHAQRVLWAIGALLILVVLVIAARQGLLGSDLQRWIDGGEKAIGKFIADYERPVDYSVKVVGAIGTLITAIIAIVKGTRYAEKRLPQRLIDFMTRVVKAVEGHAATIVAAVASPSANTQVGSALFYVGPLNRALDAIGSPRVRGSRTTYKDTIDEIDRNIELARTHLEKMQALKANAHLVRGAVATSAASYDRQEVDAAERGHTQAEEDFERAIAHPSTKAHGLELRGLLRARRGNYVGALADFVAMAEAAVDPCSVARAQRYQAEVLVKQSNGTNGKKLTDARRQLNAGHKRLTNQKTKSVAERIEIARNRIGYAELQDTLGAHHLIRPTLEGARAALDGSDSPATRDLRAEIEGRLKRAGA